MKKSAVILRLLSYFGAHKGLLALALILTVLANGIALIGPQLSEYAIDAIEAESGVELPKVAFYCGMMLLAYAVSSVLSYLLSVLMITISRRIMYRMRKQVFDHLLTLPISYFDNNQTGDIISRLSYDIDTVNTSLSNDLVQILAGSITLVGSFAMMAKICPILLPIYLVTVPILVAFTCYRVKKVKPLFRQRSARLGMLNGYSEEMLSGQKTIRAYGKEDVMIKRFDRHNRETVEAYYAADYQGSIVGPGVNFINNLSISLISMLGALLYMLSGAESLVIGPLVLAAMTPGKLSAFILYSRKFLGPINETANIVSEIQSATSAAERIFRLLDEKSEADGMVMNETVASVKGAFTVKDLNFSYTPEKPILKHIDLTVEAGKTVAIVGPTGSGKTTFVNLLMRFYECGEGKIFLDGVDIAKIPLDTLRRQFAMVLQDTWLFGASVAENIAYGSVGATREDVIAAAKTACIHEMIEAMPNGYDTVMDEEGISKGQKQLITIARMLLVHHPILILDEATSNVDSRTEHLLTEAMAAITRGRTSFIIAHRLSTVQNADVILVLKDGEIIESGTHEALLEKGGFYASLYRSQFDKH
ncbi:MAG: ABC transporter ATP-binding protein [Clostridia bacterium]|nr:ABC transporter ATP-binding protein [Clostridia bacterium]